MSIYQYEHIKKSDLKTQNSGLASHFSVSAFSGYHGYIPEETYCQICPIESIVYRCLLGSVVVFGSVWSDLLVLHNYCVIISGCQKVTFLGVEANKMEKNQSCLILPDSARKLIENVF